MRCLRPILIILSFVLAQPAFAQPSLSTDGCDSEAEETDKQLQKAANLIQTSDRTPAYNILDGIVKAENAHPGHLLSAGRLFERMGITMKGKESFKLAKSRAESMLQESEAARLYLAASLFRLGLNEEGMKSLDAVRNAEGAYKAYACHFIDVAFAMHDKGQRSVAMNLLREVRSARPEARSVHDAFVSLSMESKESEAIEAALGAARNQFPEDIEFAVRHANHMKISGKRREARKLLESYLINGEAGQSLLGELLGLVSGAENARALLPQYKALATRYPDLPAIKMMVGVMHHYLGEFAESNTILEEVGDLVQREPRVAMYMAMNYFRLGKEEEAQTYIARAADAGVPDPDVYYCRAVIFVKQDPVGSLRDLQRYMDMTRNRPDVNKSKQRRVKQTITLIEGCVLGSDPKSCVQQMVVEEARALAFEEHFNKEAVAAREKPTEKAAGKETPSPAVKSAEATSQPQSDDGGLPLPLIGGGLAVLVLFGLVLRARKSKES